MRRQYCASAYTIDFYNKKVLLVYNTKLKKWLQPGGHIKDIELELPSWCAIRETKEETGIDIKIIGDSYDNVVIQPIAIEHYQNKVGDMIDIQYAAIPLDIKINSLEDKDVIWQDILTIDSNEKVDQEIKNKVKIIYGKYR